jgi:hypothetical protein
MYTMILLLYLQQNLDVSLDQARLRGQYREQADCEAAARKLRGPLPIPANYAAAWQDVVCVKVANNVRVNEAAPLDLGKALEAYAPLRCQAEGAWERIAQMCGKP